MSKYAITVHYRVKPLDRSQLLADPEYWDGQKRVEFVTDVPIGESEGSISQEVQDILAQIGRENNYTAVALADRGTQGEPWIEVLDGESFIND